MEEGISDPGEPVTTRRQKAEAEETAGLKSEEQVQEELETGEAHVESPPPPVAPLHCLSGPEVGGAESYMQVETLPAYVQLRWGRYISWGEGLSVAAAASFVAHLGAAERHGCDGHGFP